jgi:Uma2 family endonuclease
MSAEPQPCPVVLTYDDYRRLPDDGRRYEILDGEIYVTPAPGTSHQRTSRDLGFLLHDHVRRRGLGEILIAPIDVILDRSTVVQPDLLFVAASRSAMITERGVEGPPDLVVEILSPGSDDRDRGAKRQLYARFGVAHYWLVDPVARTLSELRLEGAAYRLVATHTGSARVRSPLFPDLEIDLGEVLGP